MDTQMEYGNRELKKTLVEANKKYWAGKSQKVSRKNKWIYVYHGLSREFEIAVHEDIVGLGLQEKEQLPITVVTYGKGDELLDELDASFGLSDIRHLLYSKYNHVFSKIKTYIIAKYLAFMTYGNKDKFLGLSYRGIRCGDFIHDEIITRNRGEAFDCFDIGKARYFKYIKNALSVIDKSYEILKNKPPAYLVTMDCIYTKGLFGCVASKMGAKIWIISGFYPNTMIQVLPKGVPLTEINTASDCHKARLEEYLKQAKPSSIEISDLFVDNRDYAAESSLLERLEITNGKKNVFIFPHAFADCPRGFHHNIYHEYNEWFLDTLRIIKTIPDVNWIVKDHPFSIHFKQKEYIKKVFEENRTANMYWCEQDVSGMEIKETADCIVTCAGEAAMEYWAYGIPTVTVSVPYFMEWGFSYNIKTLSEYENTLKHIGSLKKPEKQSTEQARKCLAALKQMACTQDRLANLIMDVRKMQTNYYKQGEDHLHVDEFCKRYIDYLKRFSIESSTVYRSEQVYDV